MKNMHDMTDHEFNDQILGTSIPYLLLNAVRFLISGANLASLAVLVPLWSANWLLYIVPVTGEAYSSIKASYRTSLETLLRSIFDDIPKSVITPTDEMNIPIVAHHADPVPSPIMTVAPKLSKHSKDGGLYDIGMKNPLTPDSDARPHGQKFVVLLETITLAGVYPPNPSPFNNVYHASHPTYPLAYASPFYGKQANFLGFYLNNRGQAGPLSEMLSFIIGQ